MKEAPIDESEVYLTPSGYVARGVCRKREGSAIPVLFELRNGRRVMGRIEGAGLESVAVYSNGRSGDIRYNGIALITDDTFPKGATT